MTCTKFFSIIYRFRLFYNPFRETGAAVNMHTRAAAQRDASPHLARGELNSSGRGPGEPRA